MQSGNESFYKWIYIGDPDLRHQQYSAYFDPRVETLNSADFDEENKSYGTIRTFAILPLDIDDDEIVCIYKFDDNETMTVTPGEVNAITEHEDLEFAAFTIMCPLINVNNSKIVDLPYSIALSYESNMLTVEQPAFIPITYPVASNILRYNYKYLAVCVFPLPVHYRNVLRIAEFIELYKLLGSEKFYFYIIKATDDVHKLLDYYVEKDVVEKMDWNFYRGLNQSEVKYANILAYYNDCMYRGTFKDGFKHLAMVGIDEIIMPLQQNTLTEYVETLEDRYRSTSFIFDTVFFHQNYGLDRFNIPPNFNNKFLYSQVKIERSETPMPIRNRYIVVGSTAVEAGNHQIWRALYGFTTSGKVTSEEAVIFNYRTQCLFLICEASSTIDFTARRYGSLLWYSVENVCNLVFSDSGGVCQIRSKFT
ncbi:uncharacterized protein LOC129608478 isoform X2 [Condylostylus longicornis]|nr:uncharacterized protein LOC129608478 isoform X2 [Condylostylus longicornis]